MMKMCRKEGTNLDIFVKALGEQRVIDYLTAELPAKKILEVYDFALDGVYTFIEKDGTVHKYLESRVGVKYNDPAGEPHWRMCDLSAHSIVNGYGLSVA